MIMAMMLPHDEPQPVAKPVPPTPVPPQKQIPKITPQATAPAPVNEPTQPRSPRRLRNRFAKLRLPSRRNPRLRHPCCRRVSDAAYLNNPIPSYPPIARRTGVQGKALLRVHVSTEGIAIEVQLHQSSGSSALDEAALEAVRKWRFVPAKQGTEPVVAWVLVPIDFRLN